MQKNSSTEESELINRHSVCSKFIYFRLLYPKLSCLPFPCETERKECEKLFLCFLCMFLTLFPFPFKIICDIIIIIVVSRLSRWKKCNISELFLLLLALWCFVPSVNVIEKGSFSVFIPLLILFFVHICRIPFGY